MNQDTTQLNQDPLQPNPSRQFSVDEFANSIKQKYPVYQNIDNNTLTQKMLAKYPIYASHVNMNQQSQETGAMFNVQPEESTVNKTLKGVANIAPDIIKTPFQMAQGAITQTAKIPSEVSGLVKESGGILPAIKNYLSTIKEGSPYLDTLKSIIPSAAQKLVKGDFEGAATDVANHPFQQIAPFLGIGEGLIRGFGKSASELGLNTPIEEVPGKISQIIAKTPEERIAVANKNIINAFNRGVKPTIAGKSTAGQIEGYNNRILDAVKTITQSKNNLKITDEFGEPTGKLPENTRQFGQAIEQAKQQIFNQYDALTKGAGKQGAKVELKPVVFELNKLAKDKVVSDLHPELANYASIRAETLAKREMYSTSQAQTAIQNLNKSLESFYKNPTYETASKASVDAMIANRLREGLDKTISNVKGQGYAELKSKYASLKAIEKDVNKRAQIVARRTTGGLSFGDVFSAEEIIRGLSTMNPQAIATGVGVKGATTLWKYFNNPDRYIKNMFDEADNVTNMGKNASLPINGQEQSK